ncbi:MULTISPECIES: phage virion morphogenesis protein [unclassified Pseudomonas]|uniref:phage virion morphogenesis protein n=1 Tax=unclassified Pseudomonas TaxID=196821 RepID=UPI0014741D9D|nr:MULTISPECIES: phage virion morphogenesis protein [unclassified Pseudomonas]NMY38153.1 phage virion morphogenesis protein [Pseudomonas sp. WS 5078]NMY61069.1 phage virion morphogenesis protein [Pseudomonas sp. WS 5354]
MVNDLDALEDWAGVLLNKLEPAARSKLARSLAQKLRRSQQQRVKQQRNPDGSAYAARKPRDLKGKKGRIKRQVKMFQKLPKASYLKAKGDGQTITVGFTGRVARIARVHQYGLKDRAETDAPEVRYEQREVLGFTESDFEIIRNELLTHLR